jgi:acyl carrier protein
MDVALEPVLKVVNDFVAQKKGGNQNIGADTLLLQDGYLDSIALVELIHELEQRLGINLPDGSLIPEDFESPRVLHNRLLEI